jgi:hypothetical protein
MPDQVRHDGVALFNYRSNNTGLGEREGKTLRGVGGVKKSRAGARDFFYRKSQLAFSRNQEERLTMKYRSFHFLVLFCAGRFVTLAAVDLVFLPLAFGKGEKVSQQTFASAEDATEALGAAYKQGDSKSVAKILGDKGLRLVSSGDPVIDRYERAWFLSLYKEGHELMAESETRAVLQRRMTTLSIPIVKEGKKWRFDRRSRGSAGRRISKAELSAQPHGRLVDAQREYYRQDHDGDGVRVRPGWELAGQHDGLYWERKPEKPKPGQRLG